MRKLMRKLWHPECDDKGNFVLKLTDILYNVDQVHASVSDDGLVSLHFDVSVQLPSESEITLGPRSFIVNSDIEVVSSVFGHETFISLPEMQDPVYEKDGAYWFDDPLNKEYSIGPYNTREEAATVLAVMIKSNKGVR